MDKTPEQDESYVEEIQRKLKFTQVAISDLDERLLRADSFSQSEAKELAVEYAARRLEAWILADDLGPIELEQEKMNQRETDQGDDPKRKVESALFEAQRGIYVHLRVYLVEQMERRESEGEISNKIDSIRSLLPENGDPIKMPLFSWEDKRFNPDALPFSSESDQSAS